MSDLTIEVKNDGMLGRTTEKPLHIELIKKDKEIERLSKEVDMWIRLYNEEYDIINELEKWLKAHLDEEFYWFKMYDKLQELRGTNDTK